MVLLDLRGNRRRLLRSQQFLNRCFALREKMPPSKTAHSLSAFRLSSLPRQARTRIVWPLLFCPISKLGEPHTKR